jgi:hypothetical protein
MNEQPPPRPANEPGDKPEPARLEYLAGAGPAEAGDSACWAQFVCPECGGVITEDTGHAKGCQLRDR